MVIVGVISEVLLYLCFSILVGTFILNIIPNSYRPEINVPKKVLLLSILGIAILSFIPALQLILAFYKDIGLALTIQSVIFTFEVGKAWIITYILANILYFFIILFDLKRKTIYSYIGLVITLLLILTLGWASHAASLTEWSGFIAHTIHFLAVSVWTGILFVVSWFSKNKENWLKFLKWYTPTAITCFLIVAGTGFFLMSLVIDIKQYTNAWALSYGQALLIKHLLIIPLLVFAFINSILIRKRLNIDTTFNPKPWAKTESVLLLLIFSATGILGQQPPPHDFASTIAQNGPSKLFDLFYSGVITRDMDVILTFGINSIVLIILSILFITLTVLSFVKKVPSTLSFIMSVLLFISTYLALMISVQ